MDRLSQRDFRVQRVIQAAEGWLALGAAQAALEELTAVEPACQHDPAVLHQRARVFVALGKLPEAKAAIPRLAGMAPEQGLDLLYYPTL